MNYFVLSAGALSRLYKQVSSTCDKCGISPRDYDLVPIILEQDFDSEFVTVRFGVPREKMKGKRGQ